METLEIYPNDANALGRNYKKLHQDKGLDEAFTISLSYIWFR
jgi:hypothetical protein